MVIFFTPNIQFIIIFMFQLFSSDRYGVWEFYLRRQEDCYNHAFLSILKKSWPTGKVG